MAGESAPGKQMFRSDSSVELFMCKLEHRLPEIRERAARSLASAVSLGLLRAEQLAARLRHQLQLPDWPGRPEAMQLLRQLGLGAAEGEAQRPSDELRSSLRGDAGQPHGQWTDRAAQVTEVTGLVGDGPSVICGGDFRRGPSPPLSPDETDTMLEVRLLEQSDTAEQPSAMDPGPDDEDVVQSLPWKPLVDADLHVLTSTATSLRSGDGRAIRQALEFLGDVTLRDFPAEVFVQRPALLQAVFHVLVTTEESETDVILSCLKCLTSLVERLLQRCELVLSPDTRQPSAETSPSGSEQPAGAGGLSLPVFCGQVLSQAVSCLYVRHWAALLAAARLGGAACRLARRAVSASCWTQPDRADHQAARTALLKALKVFDEVLQWHRKCYMAGDSVLLHRCAWLLAASLLADAWAALKPPATASWALDQHVLAAPLHVLFDELLFAQQPALHGRLLSLTADAGCAELWRRMTRLRRAMEAACRLRDASDLSTAVAAAEAADLHAAPPLTERAVDAACQPAGQQEVAAAGRLLQRLLTARPVAVRVAAYRRAAAAARAALRDAGRRSVAALLQPEVLHLALSEGLLDPQTEADATDLVVYAVTSEAWEPELRPRLLAALPLFLCHVTRPQLTRPLNHVMSLCSAEHLRGDLILSTHDSRACREDAWGRIVSRLSAQNSNAALLPDLSHLGDLDLSGLMLVAEPPPAVSRCGQVNDVLTMTALMPLAWCNTASLDVRRATLAQLAVLLQDPDLHRAFLDHDGLPHLLRIITRAVMREPDLTHDVSLLPDCVTLLRHLALFSSGCRQHLAEDGSLQLLVVRVLLMFRLDARVRAAAAQLLLALGLGSTLTCQRSHAQLWEVTVPDVMSAVLRLPFVLGRHKRRRLGREPEELPARVLTEPVTVSGHRVHCGGLLRTAWALAWHGSLAPQPARPDYSELLLLPDWQLAAAGAGRLELAAAETLQQLEGVSSHTAARMLLAQLSCYVTLHNQLATADSQREGAFAEEFADRWMAVLRRHLLTTPTAEPDRRVLVATLQLLLLQPPGSPLPDRALTLLLEHSRLFTETLARAAGEHQLGQHQTALEALQLLAELCRRPGAGAASLLDALAVHAVEAAARAGSAQYYSLASVQQCAAVLRTALLSTHRLAACLVPAVRLLRDLSTAFLPAGGRTDSCMGAGVLAAAALCLHAATERQDQWTEEWADSWRTDVPDGGQLLWLVALWRHGHVQIRWGGVAATLGLTRWPEGAVLVTRQLQNTPDGVWGTAIRLLLDGREVPAVREQAALLLASLTSHLLQDEGGRLLEPEVTRTDAEACLTGVPALVTLLEYADWYTELCSLLVRLQGGSSVDRFQATTPGLVAAALRFTHNVAVLSPVDVLPRLDGVIHTLVQSSDELSPGRGWRDWPPADTVPCWTEALRLCAALVLLETDTSGGTHLLLCDRRLLDAAAATAVAADDSGLRARLFDLLLALLAVDQEAAFGAAADLLQTWPELWPALPEAPALVSPLLSLEAGRLLQLVPGRPRLSGLPAAGAALCAALLERPGSRHTLAALLLVSPAAKRAALHRRLHCRLRDQLRERIATLVTGSLSVRSAKTRAKERVLLTELLADLDLLRNLMSGSAVVKQALAVDGLPNLLHKLWPWCVSSRQLTVSVLCTLNTLAAGCADGARCLAYTSAALHQGPSASPSSSSLVHVVLDDCQRHLERRRADDGAVQRMAVGFSLLAAAALVQEGRSIICRSSFLNGFRFGRGERAPAGEQRRRLAVTRLWMLLIKNVTFFEEGQKVVARIPDVTASLVALLAQEDLSLRSSAVLVLRNLSYLTPMQTALINTDGFVSGVTSALRSGHPVACCAAAALCWQLLTKSRKARTVLTSSAHLESLKTAIESLDGASDEDTATVVDQVKDLLRQEAESPAFGPALHN